MSEDTKARVESLEDVLERAIGALQMDSEVPRAADSGLLIYCGDASFDELTFGDLEALPALLADWRRMREDAALLDYLGELNANLNRRSGSTYGWQLDVNHNRVLLADSHYPPAPVREAIARHRRDAEARRAALGPKP